MSRYIFIAFLVVLILPAYAMSDDSQWVKAIRAVTLESVEQTLDGGYIAAGSKKIDGLRKALLVRVDPSGSILWAKAYGESNNGAYASTVLQMADGGFVFTGRTKSNGGDAFVIKVDAAGNILWQRVYGTPSYEGASVILRASDGGFFLLGNSRSPSEFNSVWCMKLNSKREISWVRIYGRVESENGSAAVRTRDGGLIFAGTQITDEYNTILVKIDPSGNITWQKKLGWMRPGSIATTADGGYIVGGAGYVWGPSITVGLAAKLDSTGLISWSKMFPADGYRSKAVSAVRQEMDGHILVTGSTEWGPGRQIWNARFNLQGHPLSQQAFGEDNEARTGVSAIHDTPDDGTVFVGYRITDSRRYGLIGRASSEGDVCSAFETSMQVLIRDSDTRIESAHVGIRKGAFDVRRSNFAQTLVDTRTIDLCD